MVTLRWFCTGILTFRDLLIALGEHPPAHGSLTTAREDFRQAIECSRV